MRCKAAADLQQAPGSSMGRRCMTRRGRTSDRAAQLTQVVSARFRILHASATTMLNERYIRMGPLLSRDGKMLLGMSIGDRWSAAVSLASGVASQIGPLRGACT